MQIPWKLKSLVYSVFDAIGPRPLYWAQKHVTGRSHRPLARIPPSWLYHRDNLRDTGARRLIEFGAGKDLSQNIFLAEGGYDQVLVDLNPMLDLTLVNGAIHQLQRLGVATNGPISSREELEAKYRIRYFAPLDMQATSFEAASFDACISTNTLEHIPREVIAGIWREVLRLLRQGGIVSARIDYSDHYAHTDTRIGQLNFLTFSNEEWSRYNHRTHYLNRLRHKHHIDLLTTAGFDVVKHWAKGRQAAPSGIRPENLAGDPHDYHVGGFIVARKP